jgi:DNA primase
MNAFQAKQVPIEKILRLLGHEPAKETHGELWYYSPLRDEKEPSFKINTAKNVWYDFGHGEGGNVLSFIMTLYDIPEISTKCGSATALSFALRQLKEIVGTQGQQQRPTLISPKPSVVPKSDTIKQTQIEKIQPLENCSLIQYLRKRGISLQTAAPYVQEIYYSLAEKKYFALAFPSLSGGYELRNPYFKGAIGKKDISLVKRKNKPEEKRTTEMAVTIFEGFMDFLSALTYFQVREAKTPVIVLNSVSLKKRALEKIKEIGVTKVYLYLDRDEPGRL